MTLNKESNHDTHMFNVRISDSVRPETCQNQIIFSCAHPVVVTGVLIKVTPRVGNDIELVVRSKNGCQPH